MPRVTSIIIIFPNIIFVQKEILPLRVRPLFNGQRKTVNDSLGIEKKTKACLLFLFPQNIHYKYCKCKKSGSGPMSHYNDNNEIDFYIVLLF